MRHTEIPNGLSSPLLSLYTFLNTNSVPLKWNVEEHNLLRVHFAVHTSQDVPMAPSKESSSYYSRCTLTAKSLAARHFTNPAPPASWREMHLLLRSHFLHILWQFQIRNVPFHNARTFPTAKKKKNHLWVPAVVVVVFKSDARYNVRNAGVTKGQCSQPRQSST